MLQITKMNILPMSDLHFEFHTDGGESFAKGLDTDGVDVLVVAGDLKPAATLPRALKFLCDRFEKVVFVRGNHDVWGTSLVKFEKMMSRTLNNYGNLIWLQNDLAVIEGQRFLGCTLWYQDQPDNFWFKGSYADFSRIRDFQTVYAENVQSMEFLRREVQEGDVVITHMAPSYQSVGYIYRGSRLNRFYVCDMEKLILAQKPALWIHGHMHDSSDYKIGETRIICNPLGYTGYELNADFDPKKLITPGEPDGKAAAS